MLQHPDENIRAKATEDTDPPANEAQWSPAPHTERGDLTADHA